MQRIFEKIKGCFRKTACAVLLTIAAGPALYAQSGMVELSSRELTRSQVIDQLVAKTPYRFAINEKEIDMSARIRLNANPATVQAILESFLRGTGYTYELSGNFIIIIPDNDNLSGQISGLSGVVTDETTGLPLPGVEIHLVGTELFTVTDSKGRYSFTDVPVGNYVVKYASAEHGVNKYSQVRLATGGNATANVRLSDQTLTDAQSDNGNAPVIVIESVDELIVTPSASNRISDRRINNYGRTDNENTYILVTPSDAARIYQPKVALKTNLLYLATTSPNMAAEFYLAPHWTLDAHLNWNPWKFNSEKGGIRHWFVQPEARYWFCNTFERHFIGIHGIYGQYEIGKIDLPFDDLTEKRYNGTGVGAGVSYGYHLPISERWGLEFSLGIGYIYLNYDKYNCGTCNNKVGNFDRHYFGPTKAAVSLVFMIN